MAHGVAEAPAPVKPDRGSPWTCAPRRGGAGPSRAALQRSEEEAGHHDPARSIDREPHDEVSPFPRRLGARPRAGRRGPGPTDAGLLLGGQPRGLRPRALQRRHDLRRVIAHGLQPAGGVRDRHDQRRSRPGRELGGLRGRDELHLHPARGGRVPFQRPVHAVAADERRRRDLHLRAADGRRQLDLLQFHVDARPHRVRSRRSTT